MDIETLLADGVTRRYSEVVAASGSSDAVIVDGLKDILVTVHPGAGGATVSVTNDPETMILADTARWIEWSYGSVAVSTMKVLTEGTAVKMVNDDGSNTSEFVVSTTTHKR